jgi:hypothetical protein
VDTSPGIRRRVPTLLVGLLALGVAAGALAGATMGPATSSPTVRVPPPAQGATVTNTPTCADTGTPDITCAPLHFAATLDQLIFSHGQLLVTGEVGNAVGPAAECAAAQVNPATLRLGAVTRGPCNDPAVSGHTVSVVNTYLPDSNNATLAVAHIDPATSQVVVGPVLMTYGSYSDTRPVVAYGGGSLWIYDAETTAGPEAVQVSTATGQLQLTVPMPHLFKPLMAANGAGLWIGNSIQGGTCGGCGPPNALYYVAPGADGATVVVPGSSVVCWLAGEGDDVFAGMVAARSGCLTPTTVRFDGSDPQPVFRTPDVYDPVVAVGSEAGGILTIAPVHPLAYGAAALSEYVVWIDPNTGQATVVDTLSPPFSTADQYSDIPQTSQVYLDGSLFLMVQPLPGSVSAVPTLVRVELPKSTSLRS